MTFGYARNSGIHQLRDYGDALHKYESTTDIRGRVQEPKRPLGQRRSVDMYSIRMTEVGDIECVLYRTPVVTFHTDDTVTVKTEGWASQTTANFIPEVLYGVSARVFDHKMCLYINGEEYFMQGNEPFKLHKENGAWVATNPPSIVVHHIKRKASNNVIRKYAEVFSYLDNIRKLRTEGDRCVFSLQEIEDKFGVAENNHYIRRTDLVLDANYEHTTKLYADFKSYIDDRSENRHESFYKALLTLVNTVAWIDWQSNERRMKNLHWEQAKNLLKNMIWGFHRDEVFTEVSVRNGIVRKDTYGRFFEGAWLNYHAKQPNNVS